MDMRLQFYVKNNKNYLLSLSKFLLIITVSFLVSCKSDGFSNSSGYLTILVSRYDAGVVVTEGYKISSEGKLSKAVWDNSNTLLSVFDPILLDRGSLSNVMDKLASVDPVSAKKQDPANFILGPPPVETVEIVLPYDSKSRFKTLNFLPENLMEIIDQWKPFFTAQKIENGLYVWITEAHPDSSPIHLKTVGTDMSGILGALESDALIVPVGSDVEQFMQEKKRTNNRYLVGNGKLKAYFGILTLK